MALIERIQKDLTQAMMSKDELRLSVLRMIKSALKYKEIEKVRPLADAESLQVLQTLMKQSGLIPSAWARLPTRQRILSAHSWPSVNHGMIMPGATRANLSTSLAL